MSRRIIFFISCLLLCACAKSEPEVESSVSLAEGQIMAYRIEPGSNRLEAFAVSTDETQDQVTQLFDMVKKECAGTVHPEIELIGYDLDKDGTLAMNFTGEYAQIPPEKEVLIRAAIVSTMMSVQGVKGVTFFVDDAPLLSGSGRQTGVMTADSFSTCLQKGVRTAEVTLYFATPEGDMLCSEKRTVAYSDELESAIVAQIINGPESDDKRAVCDKTLKPSQVYVNDGVCYICFDKTFLGMKQEVAANVTIYSFVNTLTGLGNISRVQFLIDSVAEPSFGGISLTSPLTSQLDYISDN